MANQTKYNFADSTYAGKPVGPFMGTALLGGNSVERGLMTVVQNVKSRRILRNLDTSVEFRTPSAKFVGQTESIKPEERYLDPVQYEVQKEVEHDTVIMDWESENLKPGALGDYDGSADLTDFFVGRMSERVAILNEQLYWRGKAGVPEATFTGEFKGFLPLIKEGTDTFKVKTKRGEFTITAITNAGVVTITGLNAADHFTDGDVVTIVAANGNQQYGGKTIVGQSFAIAVVDENTINLNVTLTGATPATSGTGQCINQKNVIQYLAAITNQIKPALKNQPDLKVMLADHIGTAYAFASANVATGSGSYWVGKRDLDFLGRALEVVPHFADNTILVARTSNLYLGVDLIGDASNIRVVNMQNTTNEDLLRYKIAMKAACNYRFGSEIMLYHPAV